MRFKIAASIVALSWSTSTFLGQTGAAQEQVKGSSPSSQSASARPAASAVVPTPRPHFVPVLISVTDAGGSPIASLTKEQLTLLDSNQAVQPLQVIKGHDIPPAPWNRPGLRVGFVLAAAGRSHKPGAASCTPECR